MQERKRGRERVCREESGATSVCVAVVATTMPAMLQWLQPRNTNPRPTFNFNLTKLRWSICQRIRPGLVCLVCPVCQSFSQSVNSFSCVRTAWPSCPQQQQQQREKYAITAIRDSNLSFHRVELFCFASFSFRLFLYFRALFNLSLPLEARRLLPLAARLCCCLLHVNVDNFIIYSSPFPFPVLFPVLASPSLGQSLAQSHVYLICALFPSFIFGSISSTGSGTWNGTRLRFVTLFFAFFFFSLLA